MNGTSGVGGAPIGPSPYDYLPVCVPSEAQDPSPPRPGLASDTMTSFEGVVTAVSAQRLEIGAEVLSWIGPALDERFAVGDEVVVSFASAGPMGLGGSANWTVVRSSEATAATFNSSIWGMASLTLGDEGSVATPADFPALQLVNTGCCRRIVFQTEVTCAYSTLEATLGDEVVTVDAPDTVEVDAWAVTHLGAGYSHGPEYVVSAQITLLGPATAAP